jgi:hypothetical protein
MTMHVMNIMDLTGHTTMTWKPDDPASCADAEKKFAEMLERGYTAFAMEMVSTNGVTVEQQGRRIKKFDPTAGKIMLIPQIVGG